MTRWLRTPFTARPALLLCGLAVVGCGPTEVAVYPTSGKVVVDGKPAAGVRVTLAPPMGQAPGGTNPFATTGSDGSFKLTTRSAGDGAPAGTYKVVLSWVIQDGGTTEEPRLKYLLPGQYGNAESTPLTVTVAAAPTELPTIEVKSK